MSNHTLPPLNLSPSNIILESRSPSPSPKSSQSFSDLIDDSISDDTMHDCIKNMYIKYNHKKSNNQITSADELRNEYKLYRYKMELASRNIEFFMTEEDLKKCHYDSSGILPLQITVCSQLNFVKPRDKSKSAPQSPKDGEFKNSSQSGSFDGKKSRTKSLFNKKPQPKSEKPDVHIDLIPNTEIIKSSNITIKIKKIDYVINYKLSPNSYSSFKIENTNEKLSCFGILDSEVSISELKNHIIHDIVYNDRKYQIITPYVFDGFCTCMIICIIGTNYTIDFFIKILPDIINVFNIH